MADEILERREERFARNDIRARVAELRREIENLQSSLGNIDQAR